MAERDLGSTFLLPHTHLYKSERVRSLIIIKRKTFINLFTARERAIWVWFLLENINGVKQPILYINNMF